MQSKESFIIKSYNSDSSVNFDEIQAKIYNEAIEQYVDFRVTPEEIRKRILRDKFDSKGILFAFSKKNKPLAYIRYYIYPSGSLYIGYPWCTADCPPEVQDFLFNELKAYIKKKFPERTWAYMGMGDNRIKPFHEFAKKNNMVKAFLEEEFYIDVDKFSKNDLKQFSYREATTSDLDNLVRLSLEDFYCLGQEEVYDEEKLREYFMGEVFKDGNCVVLLENDTIIGSTAPSRHWRPKLSFARFETIDKKYEPFRYLLFVALAKLLSEKSLNDEKIVCTPTKDNPILIAELENHGAEKQSGASLYKMEL